ncbi:dTDP-4-dehydrorhamnose 3,5-epimerase [Hydrobacter penzbergensis]|uniref:dTDP-4-dehydrorhamnose 3,5-epimerase n=1 Tax=Hydrobacter penzbergensis TaxID=1235997 RepID=A0A8X8IFV0_9BACT|nr:dTDP-4-dehydrorhamnose 3,5-epimerase family protein [Hydrobacter penzbergensis]SDW85505.1 dTDP-4-dehydrorhamnose 3,5-epimerase [Hydrobacter penzbergensis]
MMDKIHDLLCVPLKQIIDERGAVYQYLKSTGDTFRGFGEAYYSKVNTNVVKGWKFHKEIHQHFCVPFGRIKLIAYDCRIDSPSYGAIQEIIIDDRENYQMISMRPEIWYSFQALSEPFALLANIINKPHDPAESLNLPLDNKEIPYVWK